MSVSEKVALWLAIIAVGLSFASCTIMVDARDEIRELIAIYYAKPEVNIVFKEAEWTDAEGITRRVRTEREKIGSEWESLESWCKRHNEAVEAEMHEHPPAKQK